MGCAGVLEDEVSIRVVELLIIGPVETIAVETDRKCFRQHEAYAPVRATADEPSYMEELEGPGSNLFPSPHALST